MKLKDIYFLPGFHELEITGGGDKGNLHTYISTYERILAPYRSKNISLLEIGVARGHSLKLWQKYFSKNSKILGIDVLPECLKFKKENIDIIINYAHRPENYTNKKFDIIIDDGSHVFKDQELCFKLLFNKHLINGGIYIIEDILKLETVQKEFESWHPSCQIIDHRNLHYDYYVWDKDYKGWPTDARHEPPIGHDDVMIIYKK